MTQYEEWARDIRRLQEDNMAAVHLKSYVETAIKFALENAAIRAAGVAVIAGVDSRICQKIGDEIKKM